MLLLVVAYRSLGGASPRPADSGALLRSAATGLRSALADLSASLDDAATAPQTRAQADAARRGRRVSAAAQQLLDRLPTADELDERDAAARALLAAAAEDTGWAWRMIAADVLSPGVTAAVAALREHAAECCDEADALLLATPVGEPGDRS